MIITDLSIVVFNGAISTFSVFKILGATEKDVRPATKEEKELYYNRPEE